MAYLLSLVAVFFSKTAFAAIACPVCTVAVGACLEISRHLGFDDSMIGVWAGAFTLIMAGWLIEFLKSRKWTFKGYKAVMIILSYALYIPLYTSGNINYRQNTVLSVDSFLFGMIVGTLTLMAASKLYDYMKAKNGGHAHFPFEKVVLPVGALAVVSTILYFTVC